jgi:hypothetical protein
MRHERVVRSLERARPIVESLGLDPAWCVTRDMSAGDAYDYMAAEDYDLAPVQNEHGRAVLRRTLRDVGRDELAIDYGAVLDSEQIVRLTDPLIRTLSPLRRFEQLVVAAPEGAVGVITSADLALPPYALTAFATIVMLEQGLNELFGQHGDVEQIARKVLPADAIKRIEKLISERAKRNTELSFVHSLSLEDRFDILITVPVLREWVDLTKTRARKLRGHVQTLHNTVAHAGGLLDVRDDWRASLQDLEDIDALATRVWLQVLRVPS